MKQLSAALRIICGMALVGFAYSTYRRIALPVAAGAPIQIIGVTIGFSHGELIAALWFVGVIGILLFVLGVITFLRRPS